MCNNRFVFFYNKMKDQVKKESQLVKLFSLVDKVMEKNRQRYSHELFEEFREAAMKKMQQEKEVKALEGRTEHEITELLIKLQISHSEHIMKLQERVAKWMDTSFTTRVRKFHYCNHYKVNIPLLQPLQSEHWQSGWTLLSLQHATTVDAKGILNSCLIA